MGACIWTFEKSWGQMSHFRNSLSRIKSPTSISIKLVYDSMLFFNGLNTKLDSLVDFMPFRWETTSLSNIFQKQLNCWLFKIYICEILHRQRLLSKALILFRASMLIQGIFVVVSIALCVATGHLFVINHYRHETHLKSVDYYKSQYNRTIGETISWCFNRSDYVTMNWMDTNNMKTWIQAITSYIRNVMMSNFNFQLVLEWDCGQINWAGFE